MTLKHAFITIGLCFSLGFGLTSTVPTAHACQCIWGSTWRLELEAIDGVGGSAVEVAFWQANARIHNFDVDDVRFIFDDGVQFNLEPMQ